MSISLQIQDQKINNDSPFPSQYSNHRLNHENNSHQQPYQRSHPSQNHQKHTYTNSVYHVDNLVVGTCTSGQYYLRKNGKVYGDIFITFEYFPNHQSLKCLVQEVMGNTSHCYSHSHSNSGSGSGKLGTDGEVIKTVTRDTSLLMLLLGELVGMIRHSVCM